MFISGAHVIVYSKDADADRAFLRDILQLGHVDVGGGWLIFGLPPAEVAVHPAETGGTHELYLMCDDVERFRADMESRGVATSAPKNLGWGVLTDITLPGGGKLGVYQPRHARPAPSRTGTSEQSATTPARHRSTGSTARPAAKQAAAGTARPAAKQAAAGTPTASRRVANPRAARKPTAANRGATRAAAGTPAAGKPAASRSAAAKPAATKPSASKPAAKPAATKRR